MAFFIMLILGRRALFKKKGEYLNLKAEIVVFFITTSKIVAKKLYLKFKVVLMANLLSIHILKSYVLKGQHCQ